MAQFLIRVEMHERSFDYRLLHAEMARLGCDRQITSTIGVSYALPEAEYILRNDRVFDTVVVRDYAIENLDRRGWNYWLMVTRCDEAAWLLRRVSAGLGTAVW